MKPSEKSTLSSLPDECKVCKYEICLSNCKTLNKIVKENNVKVIY